MITNFKFRDFIIILNVKVNGLYFYKDNAFTSVCVARHTQSTQNKSFHIFDTLPTERHESFLQDNSITLGVRNQAC